MRLVIFKPLAIVCSIAMILAALLQTGAVAASGPPDQNGAIAGAARRSGAGASLWDNPAVQQQREALRGAVDLSNLRAPDKPAYARLDSQLNQLIERAASSKTTIEALAADAPVSKGDAVAVTIRFSGDAGPLIDFLAAHGARIANEGDGVLEAYVPVTALAALNDAPGLTAAQTILPPALEVDDQAAAIHGSTNWNANGYAGAGVKVGIIDGGFEGITSLLGSEVPANITAHCYTNVGDYNTDLASCQNGEVHGAGVAEAVADIAPQATFYIADPISRMDLQSVVAWMASQGVQVINYSVGWIYDGPGDGTSPYTDSPLLAVDQAVGNGITWINASGNNAEATWFGPYIDTDGDGLAEFGDGNNTNTFPSLAGLNVLIELRWADSWFNATDDLDLVVVDAYGNTIGVSSEEQTGDNGQTPLEVVNFTTPADGIYTLGVVHTNGATPAWIDVQVFSQQPLEFYTSSSSVTTPADSANPGLVSVGAANWTTPDVIEDFSSRGPTPDGRIKPEIVGIDCADSVSFGTGDDSFCGTSQASPHVTGLAALVKQRFPDYTPAQVADYLKSNAIPRGDSVPNNVWGYGLAHLPEITGEEPGPAPSPSPSPSPSPPPSDGSAFDRVWATTDQAVANGQASYSWFWGPEPFDQVFEQYAESPNQQREVRYYDKSRMEINNPAGDQSSIYYVTNGLLTEELVTGRMQLGNGTFEPHAPSPQLVAGDPANNPGTPSYAAFAPYATTDGATHRANDLTGQQVTAYLDGSGALSSTSNEGVSLVSYQSATGHNIPDVFWNWMNNPNNGFRPDQGVDWLYVLGYPISEPYWIDSTVGGTPHRVLVQLYERRVLTYTPSNPAQYQVEFGNIGRHYHDWRYSQGDTGGGGGGGDNGVPADGETLYQSSLTDWGTGTSDVGSAYIADNAYHIAVTTSGYYLTAFTDVNGYGDISAQIDLKLFFGTGDSAGCLMLRAATDNSSDYALCLDASGATYAIYEGIDADGDYFSDELLSTANRGGYNDTTGWNTLKIVAKGNQLWFLENGALLGTATHDGPTSGAVGMYTYNANDSLADIAFTNMVIKAVQ